MTVKEEFELEQVRATIANLNAETANILRDTKFMPYKIGAGVIGVIVALGYVILKFSALIAV